MGCDIHAYLEKQNITTKQWIMIGEVSIHQYYDIFALLHGVRDYFRAIPIVPRERGLPSDLSKDIENEWERWEGDGHSASYLTLEDWDQYPYWNNPFPDTRQPKGSGNTSCSKSGGIDHLDQEIINPINYNTMTPDEVVKNHGDINDCIIQMREITKTNPVRLIFWFDC